MSAVASDAACVEFSQHAWKPELCVNCQRPRNEHTPVAKATKASARIVIKQSEALITAADADSSPVPSKRSATLPRQSKTAPSYTSRAPPATDEKSQNGTTQGTHQAQQEIKDKSEKKSDIQWKQTKSNQTQSKQGRDLNKSQLKQSSEVTQSHLKSKQSRSEQSIEDYKKQPVQDKSSSEVNLKREKPRGILSRKRSKSSDSRKGKEDKPNSRVAFIDTSPHIIGYDGGAGNLFDDDEDNDDDPFSSSEDSFSLTDEEKSFALLSLENTVWNSEAANLLHDKTQSGSSHHHSSREFEDLNLDTLCFSKQFQNLKDCDATRRFGTFPVRKRSSSTKVGLDSVFSDGGPASLGLDTTRLSGSDLDKAGDGEHPEHPHSETTRPLPNHVSQIHTSSNGHSKVSPAMTESSTPAYKVVNIVDRVPVDSTGKDSYTVTDITTCLYDTSQNKAQESDSVSENSGNSSGKGQVSSSESNSPTHVRGRGRSRPTAIRVSTVDSHGSPRRDGSAEKEGETDFDPLNDSATAAGLQVLALLNDVLDNYGDNESSTDDPGDPRQSDAKDSDKSQGKKATDFEARMASVAANLDLSKQQRSKRPAPRPPSSPPPEPMVSPKKKTQSQPEPIFKMVPMGKAIMTVPPTHDLPKSSGAPQGQGLPSFEDLPENEGGPSNGDANRSKKGFTSFFKNILRRGRDSSDVLEPSNPEVQFAVRPDLASTSAPSLSDASGDMRSRKGSDSASGQTKFRVLPQSGAAGVKSSSASTGDLPGSGVKRTGDGDSSGDSVTQSGQGKTSSPPSQPKSKGLSSPKQMLKRTAAKLSPPTQHKSLSHAKEDSSAVRSKPALTSRLSDDKETSEASSQPTPVRRRAKSPKRVPPPAPPARPSGGGKSEEGFGADLARELEQRLRAPSISASSVASAPSVASKPATQPTTSKSASQMLKPESQAHMSRTELRKSMTVPPPSPPTTKAPQVSRSPPTSPTHEESDSQPGSPTDDMSNSDDSPRFTEKIELPTAAPGKKGILGKLNMNRKSRAPAPPLSVKRARSISDAEKRGKKINTADISGPVLVTDVTNTSMLESRRNTISLGDDPAFSSAASTAAAQSIEKGFDDLDMPILSPLGSLENLYEAILPKEGTASKFPYYDPPEKGTRSLCPNVPAEGYLEPVAPVTSAMATEGSGDQNEVVGTAGSSPARSVGEGGAHKTEGGVGTSSTLGKVQSGAVSDKLPGEGEKFVEPEMTEERRQLIASQPIYEEIPYSTDTWEDRGHDDNLDTKSMTSQVTQLTDVSHSSPARSADIPHKPSVQSATLPHPKRKPSTDSQPRNKRRGSTSQNDPPVPPVSLAGTPAHAMTSSMSSVLPATPSTVSSASPFMTSSMNSSLWSNAPSQPVDSNGELLPLPPIPQMTPRSVSKETVSSESDTQSSSSTLSRPRPAPRRRPKRPDTTGSDQYVSMNRPNTQVTLGETKLRETFSRLTALTFQTLHDIYVQCERLLSLDKITLPSTSHLKWADFDIYGQALHASGRCVVYNSKLRATNMACQLMVLHSRPAAEMSMSTHPSLMRPAAIFADNVPFSFLTAEFIKTSQLLQNSVYDSCQARCFLAVGLFDIADSLASHLTLLRETLTHDPSAYLHVLLMTTLQLLSAMSHCLDRGFTVTETDLGDVFHIARQDLRGKVVAFLPHQRAPDVPQGEAMCGFLDKLLQEATNDYYVHDAGDDPETDSEESHLLSTVERLRFLLEPRRIECLAHVRAVIEYTLWGPGKLGANPAISSAAGGDNSESLENVGECDASSVEQDHSAWLEKERAAMVARFACSVDGLANGVALEDFYRLKFLLKSSATSLAECWRRLT